jgi:hypothetical protein
MSLQRRIGSLQLRLVPVFDTNHRRHSVAERPLKAGRKNRHPECGLRDRGYHEFSAEHRRAQIVPEPAA